MNLAEQEFFDERAGIREFDGRQPRHYAEWMAYDEMIEHFKGGTFMQVVEKVQPVMTAVQWINHGDHPNVHPHPKNAKMGVMRTKTGFKCVKPGDYIVRRAAGMFSLFSTKEFEAKFKPLSEDDSTQL